MKELTIQFDSTELMLEFQDWFLGGEGQEKFNDWLDDRYLKEEIDIPVTISVRDISVETHILKVKTLVRED